MKRILIVDDVVANIYLLESILKGYGFSVVSARNGSEALETARNNPPDLIISDILMPVMDGFELCRQWKADPRLNKIPFIFYTATYTDPRDEQFAMSLGAERFIVKPLKPEILAQIVRELIDEEMGDKTFSVNRPLGDEMEILRQYNEVLFRKLESKVMQLHADIEERTRIEALLSENEKFLDTIIENIPDMIFVKDAQDLHFVRFNKAGEALLGVPRGEMYGRSDLDFFPRDQADFFMGKDREVLNKGHILDIPRETIQTRQKGARILHTKKIPITTGDGEPKYLLGISEDITERVVIEEALARAIKKLNFLNTITFDEIQNAAFSLSGYLELINKNPTGEMLQKYIGKINSSLRSMNDSLNFAKIYQDLGLRPPEWQNVMYTFLFAISHTDIQTLSRQVEVEGLEIYADPLLERVFLELAENVVMHGKGATAISLQFEESDKGMTLFFEDDGAGIPDHMKERIFVRRFEERKGSGLFLAREILSITDITIRETGVPGKGARFEIVIPMQSYRFVTKGESAPL